MNFIRTMLLALLTAAALTGAAPALAQGCGTSNPNCIVPTAPSGTDNNQAASTAFVQSAIAAMATTCPEHQWVDVIAPTSITCTQPAFADISGVASLAQGGLGASQAAASANQVPFYPGGGGAAVPTSISAILDSIGSTRGSLLYRGAAGWSALPPGTAGNVLTSAGAGTDPAYAALPPSGRTQLSAATTYYVRTDGSDSLCNGLSDASSASAPNCAFLTIQKCVNTAHTLDFNGFSLTCQVRAPSPPATYSEADSVTGPFVGVTGSERFIIVGDTTTPDNIVWTAPANSIPLQVSDFADVRVRGFKFTSSGTATASIWSTRRGQLWFDALDFGTATNFHLWVTDGGFATATGNYAISGGAAVHIDADTYGELLPGFGNTVTITGTPAFSGAFAQAVIGGVIEVSGQTYSGSATGNRYSIATDGIISTSNGGANYFPGSLAGFIVGNGTYDSPGTPGVASCGTSPGSVSGTDFAGSVTEGTSTTGCTINFTTNSNKICSVNLSSGTAIGISSLSASSMAVTHSSVSSNVLRWNCRAT